MQIKEKKKAVILAVLVAALAIYWGTVLFGGHEKPAAVSQPAPAKKADAKARRQASIKVDLGLLDRPKERYEASKNIFSPVYRKPELRPGPGRGKASGPITATPLPPLPPPPPPKSPKEIAADNAREEMKRIKVLGFLKRKGRTDVFMSLDNSNYVVAKGDNIIKKYYLDQIGRDSVLVSDRETGVQVALAADFSGKVSRTQPSPGIGGASRPAPPPAPAAPPPFAAAPRPGFPGVGPPGRSVQPNGGAPTFAPPGGAGAVVQTPEPFSEGMEPDSTE